MPRAALAAPSVIAAPTSLAALTALAALAALLAGCAGSPPTGGSALFRDAGRAHVYTDTERRNSIHPNASGEVRYCAAGLASLVESRRREALAAVARECGGDTLYAVVAETEADVRGRAAGNIALTPGCVKGWAVYFKCLGSPPKPSALR